MCGAGAINQMDRRPRADILESQDVRGLEKDLGRGLPADDPAKEAVRGLRGAHALILSIEAPSPRSFSSIRS